MLYILIDASLLSITESGTTQCSKLANFRIWRTSPGVCCATMTNEDYSNLPMWILRLVIATILLSNSQAELDVFFRPLLHQTFVRRDMTSFLRAVSSRSTLEAAQMFSRFTHPVLLIWGKDDPFFSPHLAVRLQQAFPDARLIHLSHARAFVPLDQPEALAQHIMEFVPVA